ncbi:MAG: glycosyltransferase [Acidimicrobiales bacterium]
MLVEPAGPLAPPVVAVMVVHDPEQFHGGTWFDEVLVGLARQDYANLKTLVLLTGDPGDLAARIAAAVPRAFVRAVDAGDSFGRTANEVLRLVEGDNGFFCFLHDDVALEPDAIRVLVEEMYRSNAGVVGPKLVEWTDPTVLQHVGYAVDRFGEVDTLVEPGETDQEQHDAVRDVFALPSACLLVRADLFRSLGGFDPDISFHGEDVDLCWRAHHQGARVLVVPSAKARHLEALEQRRPDLDHEALRARHRVRTVAALTGIRRLPLLTVQLVLLTVAQFVVGILTGRVARAVAGVRAMFSVVPRLPRILARRRAVAAGRIVPDREVTGLQLRGSARVATWLRSRDARPDAQRGTGRVWRERAGASGAIGWIAIVAFVLIGSRELLTGGVPAIGQFLSFGDSPRRLLDQFLSGWDPQGLGHTGASPTGLALIAVGSTITLFHTGLFHTVAVVGLILGGAAGLWRLTGAFSTTRARLGSTIVYVGVPLSGQLVSVGRWGALLVFAALPWSIDAMRSYAGLGPGPRDEDGERTIGFGARRHVQLLAGGVLVAAVVTAFEPVYPVLIVLVAVVITLGTLVTGAPLIAPARLLIAGAAAAAGAVALDLPWLMQLAGDGGWTAIVGPSTPGDRGNSLLELATFDLGNGRAVVLAVALYLPVLTAVLLGRGWRFGWAVRGALLVVTFGWLATLDDGNALPIRLPEAGILLVPVAVGVAIAAGCVLASFELDVRGGTFGWRQPLAVLSTAAVVVGLVPAAFTVGSGRYDTPTTTLVDLLGQLPDPQDSGDYRVLWVGSQQVLPVAPWEYAPGIGYALTEGPSVDIGDVFPTRPGAGSGLVRLTLDAIATGTTTRGGRLLAPLAVRYVVVPLVDGAVSTTDEPVEPPAGLLDALGDQLDLAEVYSPPNFLVYENRAWLPMRSELTPSGAEASLDAAASALAQSDLSGATPIMVGADHLGAASAEVAAGTVHLAIPPDDRWELRLDGRPVEQRSAFGTTTAFDVDTAGTVTLEYQTSRTYHLVLLAQLLAWSVVGVAATSVRLRRPQARPRAAVGAGEQPVFTMDPMIGTPMPSEELAHELAADPDDLDTTGAATPSLTFDAFAEPRPVEADQPQPVEADQAAADAPDEEEPT